MSQLHRLIATKSLGDEHKESADSLGALPSERGPSPLSTTSSRQPNSTFSPKSSSEYFDQALQVSLPDRGLDVRVYYTPQRSQNGGMFVLHHGAGYSGTSFACLAKVLVEVMKGEVGVLAFDARGHGKTVPSILEENLSVESLVDDFCALIQCVFSKTETAPVLMLVGHSMGGSVVVHACPKLQELKYTVSGVVVLDVVEGTAMEALPYMHTLLDTRPEGFHSVEDAIEWHVKTRTINNVDSARVSVPAILVPQNSTLSPVTRANNSYKYRWRTPLRSTVPYWKAWFTSLSSLFLSLRTARLLVLAGTERLDTPLTIGQMQGKFWLEVMNDHCVGHLVHEDDFTRLAWILSEFWKRNERLDVRGVVIRRVGE